MIDATYRIRWADVDANQHMRHSAYADYAADVRMVMFERVGYTLEDFARMQLGPILFREEARYMREVLSGESIRVDCKLAGMSPDGRKWMIRHAFYRTRDGKEELCAQIIVEGAWIDMQARRIVAPPAELLEALRGRVPLTEDFTTDYPAPRPA